MIIYLLEWVAHFLTKFESCTQKYSVGQFKSEVSFETVHVGTVKSNNGNVFFHEILIFCQRDEPANLG